MFYALCTLIVSVIVFGFSAAEIKPIPPIIVCKRDSTNYSNCSRAALQESWPKFIKGLPEFDLPPLDPLFFEFSTFVFDKGALHGVVNISNFIFTGLANTRFLAVRSHFGNKLFRLEIDLQVPKVEGSGACNAVGMLAEFRMGGKGHINFTIEDFQVAGSITGHVANDILTVEHVHAVPSIKNIKLYFEDLFNGNKDLNDLAMIVANEYWPIFYRVVLPSAMKIWDPWLCDLFNRFFSKVSFKQTFP